MVVNFLLMIIGMGGGANKIQLLAFNMNYPCQLSCKYCSVPGNARHIADNAEIVQKAKDLNVVEMMHILEERNILDLKEPIQFAAGEITILPNKKEILDCLSKYPMQIFSNCVLYDQQVSDIISRKDGSFLNVSIDAGSRETYYKVKGMDVYNKVLDTVRRYASDGAVIEVKYILLPENCDKENIDRFLDFCREISPRYIRISCDITVDHTQLAESIVEAAIYMAYRSDQLGIPYSVLPYFGEQNMERIYKELQLLGGKK